MVDQRRGGGGSKFIDRAYGFFRERELNDVPFTLAELVAATGWKDATATGYMKKLYRPWLRDVGGGHYRSSGLADRSLQEFRDLHSQTSAKRRSVTLGLPGAPLPARYHPGAQLGSGYYGAVFRCWDSARLEHVAVKVIYPHLCTEHSHLLSLRREAAAANALIGCSRVVHIHEVAQFENTHYLSMELMDGGSLRELLRDTPTLTERHARQIGADVADALAFAHQRGVLHRDVKPGNILFTSDGETRLSDFGLSRILESASRQQTRVSRVGTETYMAPEIDDEIEASRRSDLFSLGVVIFEMIAGKAPTRDRRGRWPRQNGPRTTRPPDVRNWNPGASEQISKLLKSLLARRPNGRPDDAAKVATELRRWQPSLFE